MEYLFEEEKVEHWKPIIGIEGIDGERYGLYPDGTVVNLEIPMVLSPYIKRGGRVVDLHGFKKVVSMPIMKLVAMTYVEKTFDDCIRLRNRVILIDDTKKIHANNIMWVNALEQKLIKELKEIENRENKDYVVPICKMLERGYDADEICHVLGVFGFTNKLYIANIKNRRIYKDISKKYKW